MTRYLTSHRWLAGAVALAFTLALLGAACGSSSAKNKPAAGSAGGVPGGTTADRSIVGAPANDSQLKSISNETAAQQGAVAAAPASGASGTSSSSGGGAPNPLPSTLDRKIIQTATLTITTDEVSKKFEDVQNIAASAGGFVASSSFGTAGDRQTASITIRVPGDSYQRALSDLRKLGDVKGEQSGANDVTEEFTDLQSRLRNLQATEAQYVQFLLKAQNINEVLTIQDRLNSTRAEIEQVQGRLNLVQHQTDLATITVHLDPPVVAKVDNPKADTSSGPLEVAADSFQASLTVLVGIATVALAVAAFSWWLVPLAIGGVLIARRQFKPARERQAIPPPAA